MHTQKIEKNDNPFLERIEVEATIDFEGAVPKRSEMRKHIAKSISVDDANVAVISIGKITGRQSAFVKARAYPSQDALKASEPKHILKRNKLLEEKPAEGADKA